MASIGYPMVYMLEDIEQMPLRHPSVDGFLKGAQALWERCGFMPLQVRCPVQIDRQLAVTWEIIVNLSGQIVESMAQRRDKVASGYGQSDSLAVIIEKRFTLIPW